MGGKEKESKKDRKAAKDAEESERRKQVEEDAKWAPSDKKDKKKAEKESQEVDRKLQQEQKALEKKRLMEEEEEALKSVKSKNAAPERLTRAQIEENMRKMQAETNKGKGKDKKVAVQAFDEVNENRLKDEDSATGVEEALRLMAAAGVTDAPKLAAAHKEFEARQLPILKQQCPGLKMSQYKEMAWKLWQKSPENPLNNKA
eukprot:EG_transcript_26889